MEIDHLGIAVPRLDEALRLWTPILGGATAPPEEVPTQRVRVAFLEAGGSHVELLEPTDPASPVGRFLQERGGGLHHVAFRVPDVTAQLKALEREGYRLIDREARPGARGRRVGFVHPRSVGGVLVELVEAA